MKPLALPLIVVVVVLAAAWFAFGRAESVTFTVTDTYNTDSSGAHPLPEEQQRPETLTNRWVAADNGLTYQASEGKFEIGKRYTCSVHQPGSGLEVRDCKAA
jgi:hypothetical protein